MRMNKNWDKRVVELNSIDIVSEEAFLLGGFENTSSGEEAFGYSECNGHIYRGTAFGVRDKPTRLSLCTIPVDYLLRDNYTELYLFIFVCKVKQKAYLVGFCNMDDLISKGKYYYVGEFLDADRVCFRNCKALPICDLRPMELFFKTLNELPMKSSNIDLFVEPEKRDYVYVRRERYRVLKARQVGGCSNMDNKVPLY